MLLPSEAVHTDWSVLANAVLLVVSLDSVLPGSWNRDQSFGLGPAVAVVVRSLFYLLWYTIVVAVVEIYQYSSI